MLYLHFNITQEFQLIMTSLDTFKCYAPIEAHLFIEKVVIELLSHQVKIIASEEKQVSYDSESPSSFCSGYFNDEPLTFAVALNKPFEAWFLVFIHEYCHFLQYLENPQYFSAQCEEIDAFFSWLEGEELKEEQLKQYLITVRNLEADCENRAIINMNRFNISHLVNVEQYIQKANSYFNFYNYVFKYRKWYVGGKEPYSIEAVWSQFPKKLIVYEKMTQEHEQLFHQCV